MYHGIQNMWRDRCSQVHNVGAIWLVVPQMARHSRYSAAGTGLSQDNVSITLKSLSRGM